jgi:hypothetical protein
VHEELLLANGVGPKQEQAARVEQLSLATAHSAAQRSGAQDHSSHLQDHRSSTGADKLVQAEEHTVVFNCSTSS